MDLKALRDWKDINLIEYFPKLSQEELEDGKLRAKITDYSGKEYNLKVSCKYIRVFCVRKKLLKKYHRRLVVEYLASHFDDVKIVHL